MPIALLTVAMAFGLFCAAGWLIAGGGLLSAFLVYVMSGNLAVVAVLGRVYLRGTR